ncbi:MAG: hypothetical protein L3J30_13770 [Marinosulfonomonas sp.]|nr:hypothetical protein [Marinosulfonomonas sp.]
MSKSLLFVTGTRADSGKLEPLAIAARDARFKVSFFVTGMHMMQRYGMTKIEVHRMHGITVLSDPDFWQRPLQKEFLDLG